jgi:hypothetical protein
VVGDVPDSPQGELLRDVQLSVAKFYLGNLREEVKKGLSEKAAQGGWTCHAPLGYLNDKATRTIIPDPVRAPLVRHVFERYATGLVSLRDLADELHGLGLRHVRSGRKVYPSSLHGLLRNPAYCGMVRYQETIYSGKHEPLVSLDLFEQVQKMFEPNRNGNKEHSHVFALRDFLWCGKCGCKITAERQMGFVYYRCSLVIGRELCPESAFTREERLLEQVDSILSTIEVGPGLIEGLVKESRILDEQQGAGTEEERRTLKQAIQENSSRTDRLLDSYLENLIDDNTGQISQEGWCADYPDPENFADVIFHSGAEMNTSGYSNPELDAILEQARVERDVTSRIKLYQQAERIIVEDVPAIFLSHSISYTLVKPYIQGYVEAPMAIPFERYLRIDPTKLPNP